MAGWMGVVGGWFGGRGELVAWSCVDEWTGQDCR